MQSNVSILSTGTTGDILTPEKRISKKKSNVKSIETSSPRKDTIPNQDKKTLGIEKDQILPPHLPKFFLGVNH